MIYLDHSATSPMTQATLEAMWPYMTTNFANASSQHEAGKLAAAGLLAARTAVAEVCGVDPGEVIFTSGGTESDNLAIKGSALAQPRGRHIITSAVEHEAVLQSCAYLERHHGFRITYLPVDRNGFVDLAALGHAIDTETTLVSIQYANNEVGTIQDVAAIASICNSVGVPFHCDAVQAAGLLPLDIGADLLAISAHKFGGPKGVGALVKRSTVFLEPLLHGGGQESGMRSSTSNVAGAVGMAAALYAAASGRPANADRLTTLRDQLIHGVLSARPDAALTGNPAQRLPHHASFTFKNVSGESLLLDLEAHGIACSSGSACAASDQEPSYVLMAMDVDPRVAETAVRFTLGSGTTEAAIKQTIDFLAD